MKIKAFFKENISYIIILIVTFLLFYIELPFYIMAPGGTIDISDKVIIDDGHKLNGKVNMLYASSLKATIPTYLFAKISNKWDEFPNSERQIGHESSSDVEFRDKILLDNSVDNAIYVAYKASGKDIQIKNVYNYVIGKVDEAKCELAIGDIILEADGKDITSINLNEYIASLEVGDNIDFKVTDDKDRISSKKCSVVDIDGAKKVGILYSQNFDYDTSSIDIKFNGSEGGSSGGFMMSLSIYLALSDEDLLRGRNIAGTGTIDINGVVGEIGGVKYKIIGAHNAKVDLVFVPLENYNEAMYIVNKYNYDMEIVKVHTLEDAINYLKG